MNEDEMERIAEQSWNSSYTYQVSKHSAEMLHNLNVQRKDGGRFCDVILRVGEESFPAHKAVLAACSEYFESVFSCQVEGDGETKELEMHTISPKVFKDILDFAYTSKIVVRLECFPELMTAAKFLLMRSVIEICQEVIKQSNVQILVPPSRGDLSLFRTAGGNEVGYPLPLDMSNGAGLVTNGPVYGSNGQTHDVDGSHTSGPVLSSGSSQSAMPVLHTVDRLPVTPTEQTGNPFQGGGTPGSGNKRGRGRPKKVPAMDPLLFNHSVPKDLGIFPCGICGKIFTETVRLRNHEAQHAASSGLHSGGVNNSGDSSVGVGGPTPSSHAQSGLLENGLTLHSGVDASRKRERTRRHVGCDICGKVFRDVYHLNRHKLSHSGEKPYACPVCGLRFKRKDRMSYHVRSHDGSVGKPYVCQSCGKGFSRPDHLNGHIKQVHTSERPHKCQICNASFATRDRLRSHLACHEDKIPCQVCGKFLRAAYMTDHLKKHSEGPHNYCGICNKDGQEDSEKCPHQDSESSDASFGELSDGGDLKSQHKAEEGSIGVFTCSGSGGPSAGASKLKVDPEKKHPCTDCGQAFRSKSYLNKHVQRVHSGGAQKGLTVTGTTLGELAPSLGSPFSPQQNMSLLESFGFQIVQSAFASSLADSEAGHSSMSMGSK
ncbi:POZ-, AT hook-, and zinc finger-containing protein 1-like isoform X3 [Anguilla rostrata]|uniref:POZ-, AT hook-, and zinc finger-containing protein 1-like isoform X3 n=1 Tax=Anguilla rostrata TaxID=7938 RepID=UPI0030D07403